jgi:acyl dehydratase
MFDIDSGKNEPKMVSGRAIISRMEGEFTRLRQIYGNLITLYGIDGDTNWENRQTRFVKPLYTDEVMKIKFTISEKKELDDEFGLIAVDYEGLDREGNTIVTSKKNLYRIKKNPPSNL